MPQEIFYWTQYKYINARKLLHLLKNNNNNNTLINEKVVSKSLKKFKM